MSLHALPDVHPDLEGLLREADQRGWRPDPAKKAARGRWISADQETQLTVVGAEGAFRTAVISAQTSADQFRASIGDPERLPKAVAAVRAFLGWDDTPTSEGGRHERESPGD